MGFYSSEVRLDGEMEIDLIGHDPETGLAHILLAKAIPTEGDTAFVKYKISIPLPLLSEATRLAQEVAKKAYVNPEESSFFRPHELPVA